MQEDVLSSPDQAIFKVCKWYEFQVQGKFSATRNILPVLQIIIFLISVVLFKFKLGQSVTMNTRIRESESMLWTFLVIFLGGEGVRCVLHNLL